MATPTMAPTMGPTDAAPTDVTTAVVGLACALLCHLLIDAGNNMQCFGMHTLEVKAIEERIRDGRDAHLHPDIEPSDSKVWVAGTCLSISGHILNFVAFAFAPATVLAPLETVQFASNVVCRYCLFGVSARAPMEWMGVLAVVIGALLIVASALVGGQVVPELTISEMLELYTNIQWVGYCVVSAAVLAVVTFARSRYLEKPHREEGFRTFAATLVTTVAVFGAHERVQTKIFIILMVFNGFFSATFWGHWFTYATFGGMVALKVASRMNETSMLESCDPLCILLLAYTINMLFFVIGGGIYFKEFERFTLVQSILYGVGVGCVVVGMLAIWYVVSGRYWCEEDQFSDPDASRDRNGVRLGIESLPSGSSKKQLYAEEQELRRMTNQNGLTREDANKVKALMNKLNLKSDQLSETETETETDAEQTKLGEIAPASNDPPPPASNDPPPPSAPPAPPAPPLGTNASQRAAIERSSARRATMEIEEAPAKAEAETKEEAAYNRILDAAGF